MKPLWRSRAWWVALLSALLAAGAAIEEAIAERAWVHLALLAAGAVLTALLRLQDRARAPRRTAGDIAAEKGETWSSTDGQWRPRGGIAADELALLVALWLIVAGIVLWVALGLAGCGPVQRTATREARCDLVVGPPHTVRCWVDGDLAYEQAGPQKLALDGCCRCGTLPLVPVVPVEPVPRMEQ